MISADALQFSRVRLPKPRRFVSVIPHEKVAEALPKLRVHGEPSKCVSVTAVIIHVLCITRLIYKTLQAFAALEARAQDRCVRGKEGCSGG